MITNETIIKAAKAAGLDVVEHHEAGLLIINDFRQPSRFNPLQSDTDNAMIMDGAGIQLRYYDCCILATSEFNQSGVLKAENFDAPGNKSQARRDAVILCAAAKWDAMNGEVK